jgi:hypothetical protein
MNERLVTFVLIAEILIAGRSVWAQSRHTPNVGSLCVLPHVKKVDALRQSPEVPPAAEEYSRRLDGGNWVVLSSQSPVLLAEIPLAGRHKVFIRGDGKPFSAFTFTFEELRATNLCLSQSGLYLVWRFHPPAESYVQCRCTGVEPAAWIGNRHGQ